MEKHIGLIGLGKMGYPIALHAAERCPLAVYDKDPEAARDLGRYSASSVADVGRNSSLVLLMVPAGQTWEIVFDQGLAQAMGRGTIIDGGNADYRESVRVGGKLASQGIDFLDIGLSGGPPGAEAGKLAAMVGGKSQQVQEETRLFLDTFCSNIVFLGSLGNGHYTKTLHNVLEYAIEDALGQAYALAREKGMYPAEVLRAISRGPFQSRLAELLLDVGESEVEAAGSRIDGGGAAEIALREAEESGIGALRAVGARYARRISHDLYEENQVMPSTTAGLVQDIQNALQRYQDEHGRGGVRSFAVSRALRRGMNLAGGKSFGGVLEYAVGLSLADALGEVDALSRARGMDPKMVVEALNTGLSQTRLGERYLELTEDQINDPREPHSAWNVLETVLRGTKAGGLGSLGDVISLHRARIENELGERGKITYASEVAFSTDLLEAVQRYEQEEREKGTVGSFAVVAALRKRFGGHHVYPAKDAAGSPENGRLSLT